MPTLLRGALDGQGDHVVGARVAPLARERVVRPVEVVADRLGTGEHAVVLDVGDEVLDEAPAQPELGLARLRAWVSRRASAIAACSIA